MLWQMADVEQMQTRLSLLFRLTQPGPRNESAWREFVEHYAPLIYRWCRNHKLQDSDARDVTQQVMLKLAVHLPSFSYDPKKSFRAWLRTLSYHAWVDFLSDHRTKTGGDSEAWNALLTVESREDLLQRISDEFDLELLERAMARVQQRVEPATWEAFRLTAIEGVPAAEVAQRLGKAVATVYVARSSVKTMLREEVAELESSGEARPTDCVGPDSA
jgi:RNA polymerase sigma-70 factor (ECF subfamily)